MSTSSIGASRAFFLPLRRAGSRASVATLMALLVCSASMPLHAANAEDESHAILLLEEDELATAAIECGIGIAGERVRSGNAAAMPAPIIGVGKWVAGLLAGHIQGVLTRRLGLDQEYNRFLALSQQLRQIESQIEAIQLRFDQLGDQLRFKELRQSSEMMAERFVDPVQNGTEALEALACAEAAALNAERMGGNVKYTSMNRDRLLRAFRRTCRDTAFENMPRNLTTHFLSVHSILDRYVDAVIRPRRYLTHQDAQELDDFFHRYHLIQIQALRLTAECELRFPPKPIKPDDPALRASVADTVYRAHHSHAHRAQIDALPGILPEVLAENVVFDADTGVLWWNGVDYGAHPAVNRHHLIQDRTISLHHEVAGPSGARRFELATFDEVETFAALGAPMPTARRSSAEDGRYPATLKPFLDEVGLDKVAGRIPDAGDLSFVWTSSTARPIRRCRRWSADLGCTNWYDPHDALGHNAVIAPANRTALRSHSGDVWHVPQQCQPNQCTDGWNRRPEVISLCKDPRRSERNVCIADTVLGTWQAPGLYRSAPRPTDRFFAFDLSGIR
jgi:hypothetical protein